MPQPPRQQVLDELATESTDTALLEEASAEYVGRWNHLVSTTNWEKGRIISLWRASLIGAEMPVQAYSDEAWARRVGNVSGQHVGRLRRVWERFGETCQQYSGLYWSHFQAALDWSDGEMWLEGAVQNGWSVSQMRTQRWEAIGAPFDERPPDEDVFAADFDEDADPADDCIADTVSTSTSVVHEFEDELTESDGQLPDTIDSTAFGDRSSDSETVPFDSVRPFEHLPKLPDDLAEAFESFKLAILAHKLTGWQEISCGAVLAVLDGLKQLTLAPSAAEA